jgi:alpha 1,3-glucosidase
MYGVPPMRPMWYEFPQDEGTYGKDDQHLVGDSLLVHPVTQPSTTKVTMYFPGDELWYDIWNGDKFDVHGEMNFAAPYDKIPVFQRGGTIVPRRERIRRSATVMHDDPLSLYVAVDKSGKAEGTLYLDDGKSFGYRDGKSIYIGMVYDNGNLQAKMIKPALTTTKVWLEKVVIQGVKSRSGNCKVDSPSGVASVGATYDYQKEMLVVRKPGVNLGMEWSIQC